MCTVEAKFVISNFEGVQVCCFIINLQKKAAAPFLPEQTSSFFSSLYKSSVFSLKNE